jgi:EAL domain-containing protein (putative c-di-GMP-specific phosphodiesterase class I)
LSVLDAARIVPPAESGCSAEKMMKSSDDRAFVHTLVDLSRRLGLKTVAEWVQDEQTAALLSQWGVDYLQGALIGLAWSERPWATTKNVAAQA